VVNKVLFKGIQKHRRAPPRSLLRRWIFCMDMQKNPDYRGSLTAEAARPFRSQGRILPRGPCGRCVRFVQKYRQVNSSCAETASNI
jgi:hypothetical protein